MLRRHYRGHHWMIERYTRPEMARVWSDENKLDTWLRVELLVAEGWTREGVIAPEEMERLRRATPGPH